MRQTWLGSLLETAAGIIIGFAINYGMNWWILPLYGFTTLTHAHNFEIGVIFTVVSVVRSLVLRRIFNRIHRCHK